MAGGGRSTSTTSTWRMGATRRSEKLAHRVVFLGATTTSTESLPWSATQALGRRENLRLAVPEPAFQSRLRAAVHHRRGTDLRRDEPSHASQAGPKLTSQTVSSLRASECDYGISQGDTHEDSIRD